jgi:hypothetical protein
MKPIDNIDKREKIANALNKNLPISVKQEESQPPVDHLQDDYEASRDTYKKLIDKGSDAIDVMMELAQDSQHPRAFEVLATLLKTQSDNADKLLDLQKKMKTIKEPTKANTPATGGVTNNNVFVGSTTDLQRFILAQQNNKVIDVDSNSTDTDS